MNNKRFDPLQKQSVYNPNNDFGAIPINTPTENHAILLTMLNSANSNFKKYNTKKVTELQLDTGYKVLSFKKQLTKFGPKCIAKLEDPSTNDHFEVFLPNRYSDIPSLDNLTGVYMIYNGFQQSQNGFNYHHLTFSGCPILE